MVASLVTLVVYLIIVGLVFYLLLYLIDNIPLAAPFNTVARTIILVVGVLIVIILLLQFAGLMDGGILRLK
jgi:hypothetical protein